MSVVLSQKANLEFRESDLPLPLSSEEEKKLFQRLEENHGDEEARKEIIERNRRLVYYVVCKIRNTPSITGLEFEDLCDVGVIGLTKGVDIFHWRRGHKFSTYVFPLIIQEITNAIYHQARMVRVPTYRLLEIAEFREVEARLFQKLKRLPSTQEIAEKMRIKKTKVDLLKQVDYNSVSLESPLRRNNGDEKGFFLIDTMEDQTIISPLANALRGDLRRELIEALASYLDIREKKILTMRFWGGYTLKKVGETLGGMTKERVRQIQNTALGKLKRNSQLRGLLE